MRKKGIILGVGVVDVDYQTQVFDVVDGKRKLIWICPFYEKWKQMIRRCYSEKEKNKNIHYKDVTCHPDWLSLKKFKSWMETQEYLSEDGKLLELDKDILFEGNKIYSPDTCVFLHHKVNSFIFTDTYFTKTLPLGVTSVRGKYQAQCLDPFRKRPRNLGYGYCPQELHIRYLKAKYKYACELAESEYVTDERVAKALKERYKKRLKEATGNANN